MILASNCNFNYLQIFVKAKFTVGKFNPNKISERYNEQVFYESAALKNFAVFT